MPLNWEYKSKVLEVIARLGTFPSAVQTDGGQSLTA
jgi:hypothetical protein